MTGTRGGFSLIELLVVIAIIGILAVMMMPNFLGAQDRAREAGVKSVMHAVQLSVEHYHSDHETYPTGAGVTLAAFCESILVADGYLSSVPKNPFTGGAYTAEDTAGQITYSYDADAGQYTLVGVKRDGATVLLTLSNV